MPLGGTGHSKPQRRLPNFPTRIRFHYGVTRLPGIARMYSILETGFAVTSPARGPLGEGTYRKSDFAGNFCERRRLSLRTRPPGSSARVFRFSYSMKGVESNSARPNLPWSAKGSPG